MAKLIIEKEDVKITIEDKAFSKYNTEMCEDLLEKLNAFFQTENFEFKDIKGDIEE